MNDKIEHIRKYGINLMWINASQDDGEFICAGKNLTGMQYGLTQLKKWCVANPEADVNFWYDSMCTNLNAIRNTQRLLQQISDKAHLRDIREIPFVRANSDLFLPSIPIYFRVDFLKLILCLYLMEHERMDSVIYTDMSIGDKVERVLSKRELFNPDALEKLNQYGMLLGIDDRARYGKPENQFLQTLRIPELMESMKHTINCCLLLATNTLNNAIRVQHMWSVKILHEIPFDATLKYIHLYLLILQSKEPIKIRADVINAGSQNEWVIYEPLKHGYIMLGRSWSNSSVGCFQTDTGKGISLGATVRIPESLKSRADIIDIKRFHIEFSGNNVLRLDLNPGKKGSDHEWKGENLPLPTTHDGKFHPAFWPQSYKEEPLHSKQETDGEAKATIHREEALHTEEIPSETKVLTAASSAVSIAALTATRGPGLLATSSTDHKQTITTTESSDISKSRTWQCIVS